MASKNGVQYRQWLIPANKQSIKSPYTMNAKKITYHNTDNMMPASNEVSYMRNNNNQTSYHIAVDEKEAVQGLKLNRNGWHSGDGGRGYGNRNTIAIEICRNYDRNRGTTRLNEPLKSQYAKAELNAVKVGAVIMYEQGIAPTLSNIKFHHEWSGKNCPSKILNERRGNAFKALAVSEAVRYKAKMDGGHVPSKPSTSKPSGSKSIDKLVNETLAGLHGNGDARKKSLGSNFNTVQSRINAMGSGNGGTPAKSARTLANEVIAGKHGYGDKRKKSLGGRFNEVQKVVNSLLSGSKPAPSKPKPSRKSTQQLVNEVNAGKHGHGDKRKKSLGSRYQEVQNAINKGVKPSKSTSSRKSTQTLVNEVNAGKHGSGDKRKKSLGSRYQEVQNAINKGTKSSSSSSSNISKLADKIMYGKGAPRGIAKRQRWLGVSSSTYKQVQKEINRRYSK